MTRPDQSTATVARTFFTNWISRSAHKPSWWRIKAHNLSCRSGGHLLGYWARTLPPGIQRGIERWHRTLKVKIMCISPTAVGPMQFQLFYRDYSTALRKISGFRQRNNTVATRRMIPWWRKHKQSCPVSQNKHVNRWSNYYWRPSFIVIEEQVSFSRICTPTCSCVDSAKKSLWQLHWSTSNKRISSLWFALVINEIHVNPHSYLRAMFHRHESEWHSISQATSTWCLFTTLGYYRHLRYRDNLRTYLSTRLYSQANIL